MTEEDVKRIIAESILDRGQDQDTLDRETAQWLVRASFEEGWRAAGGNPIQSHHTGEPVGWRLAWMGSRSRDLLRRYGMISGQDSYK